jgi:hypothetical protein
MSFKKKKKRTSLCGEVLGDGYGLLGVCEALAADMAAEQGKGARPAFMQQPMCRFLILSSEPAVLPQCGL